MSRRVVVTGMGAVTPIGNNVKDFWENVKKGTVGIGPITKFDTTDYKAHLAAEVKDFDPTIAMDKKSARRMEISHSMRLWLQKRHSKTVDWIWKRKIHLW